MTSKRILTMTSTDQAVTTTVYARRIVEGGDRDYLVVTSNVEGGYAVNPTMSRDVALHWANLSVS